MPEGDTVLRTARRLHEALAGRPLIAADLRWPGISTADLRGMVVTEVTARGKHLLLRLDSGWTLHSHLRMEGQWRIERTPRSGSPTGFNTPPADDGRAGAQRHGETRLGRGFDTPPPAAPQPPNTPAPLGSDTPTTAATQPTSMPPPAAPQPPNTPAPPGFDTPPTAAPQPPNTPAPPGFDTPPTTATQPPRAPSAQGFDTPPTAATQPTSTPPTAATQPPNTPAPPDSDTPPPAAPQPPNTPAPPGFDTPPTAAPQPPNTPAPPGFDRPPTAAPQPTSTPPPAATQRTSASARPDVRAVLVGPEWTAIGLRLGMLDLVRTNQEHTLVGHLGPDILDDDFDAGRAVANLAASEQTVGAALLDQRNLAGIGTLWSSESLFLERLHPWVPAADLAADTLDRLVERARRLMRANLPFAVQSSTGDRRDGRTSYVHARSGRPCRRCGTTVRVHTIGPPTRERPMFYCPGCQGGLAPGDAGPPPAPLGARRRRPY